MKNKVIKTSPRAITTKNVNVRRLIGTVASAKMQKTVVVVVNSLKEHAKYKKQYLVSKRYKAHDEKGEYKVGDKVVIAAVKPMSREKRWVVVKKI